jgi:hypothetical protein
MSLIRLRVARLFPLICAVTLAAFAGCASTTTIQSQPPGARVLLNGAVVGNTPYTMTDTKIVGSATQVRLEYPGYQPVDAVVTRNEELDVLALVGGIFLLVPFLWIMKYRSTHMFALQPAYGQPYPTGAPGVPLAPAAPPPPPPAGPAGYPTQ